MQSPLYIIAATAVLGLSAISYTAVAEDQPLMQNSTSTLRLLAASDHTVAPLDMRVGDRVDGEHLHLITAPGAYGLSLPPAGNRYAIVGEHIVRIDPRNGKILSILRPIDPARE